jgi:hypothetical protein
VCFKCEQYGHRKSTSEKPIYGKCSGEHKTGECPHGKEKIKCTNCKSTDHGSWSTKYPKFIESQRFINPMYDEIQQAKAEKHEQDEIWKTQIGTINKT